MKNLFLPTESNNYTPKLLKRQAIVIYTLILLLFNILTAHIGILRAYADVDSQSLLTLHNTTRQEHNLAPLKLNSKLSLSALNKAKAMLETNCWDHYCPEGKSPWDFFDDAGYNYIYAGENLAEGFTSNEKLFNAWMNSKTHRENILREDFEEIGIAIVYGDFQGIKNNALVVVHFGTQVHSYSNSQNDEATIISNQNPTSVNILTPNNGELLNNNTPTISGVSPNGTLEIQDNLEKIGESIGKEGLFTYRIPNEKALKDGSHNIKVTHEETQSSDAVTFTVDTTPPQLSNLEFDSIIKSDKSFAILSIQTSPDTISIETDVENIKIYKIDSSKWQLEIAKDILDQIPSINLTAFDEASNKSMAKFNLQEIKGAFAREQDSINDLSINLTILQKIDIRRIINSIFILIILGLILIDYYALKHTTLPITTIRSKTQYHFSMFLILLFISIAGGTAGELLTAQSL